MNRPFLFSCFLNCSAASFLLACFLPLYWTANLSAQSGKEIQTDGSAEKQAPETEKKPSLKYWEYSFAHINDLQNAGLMLVHDDMYTFGLSSSLVLENWDIDINYKAFTDRNASNTRIDTLNLGLSYTWGNILDAELWRRAPEHRLRRAEISRDEPFYLGIQVRTGLFIAGKLGGEVLQNILHGLINESALSLDYLAPFASVQNQLQIFFAYGQPIQIPAWREAQWQLGLFAEQEFVWGYQERFAAGLNARFSSGTSFYQLDVFFQQLAYWEGRAEHDAESLWQDTATAFWWRFSTRFGLYQRNIYTSFGNLSGSSSTGSSGMGFGSIEFSISSIAKKKSFAKADASQSVLFGIDQFWVYDRFAFRLPKLPFSVGLSAIRQIAWDQKNFASLPRFKKRISYYILFGYLQPTIDLKKLGFLDLYLGFGPGLAILKISQLPYALEKHEQRPFGAFAAELGLRWYGLQLRQDGAAYGLEASLLFLLPFAGDLDAETQGTFTRQEPKISFMLGFSVMVDF